MTAPAPDYEASSRHQTVAQVERAQLCDTLLAVGPQAPTLCAGWDAHHLAAHLVAREGSPLGLATVVVTGNGNRAVERLVGERDFESLVDRLRGGPPRLSFFGVGVSDRWFNAVEFFVHHEDVRRARPGVPARVLPPWAQDQLWKGLGFTLGGLMRKAPVGAAIKRSDTHQMRIGAKKAGTVVVVGLPSELALFANGRGDVADVTLEGEPADVSALQAAHFGF